MNKSFIYSELSTSLSKDELGAVGWFGKNSDMVVDIQVITDWHKCQVVEAAKLVGVPESIISRKPVGDLLDMSTDEENFGCTYDELAWFVNNYLLYSDPRTPMNDFMMTKFNKLRALHERNAHKYQGQTYNPFFIK